MSTLQFSGFGSFAGQFFNNPDQIVKNLRTNSGLRIPLEGRTDLSAVQPYRMNPYGMAFGNWYSAGIGNNAGTLYSEKDRKSVVKGKSVGLSGRDESIK